ncbi:unnamed protein product [Musa banksii]
MSTMALESWLSRVKSAISTGLDTVRTTVNADAASSILNRKKASSVGILAFEIAGLMSKLLHLWRSLSDAQIARLRNETIALPGIRKIVSDDESFLLGLACAELVESLRLVADSVSMLSQRCSDPALRGFCRSFREFSDFGHDANRWAVGWKEMDSKAKKMDRYVASTAALYKEMDEMSEAEHSLRKIVHCGGGYNRIMSTSRLAMVAEIQQKIFWQKQQVKYLKQTSLWSCTFDAVVSLLARSVFTVVARIKHVFRVGSESYPLPRSLSGSATVFPSSDTISLPWKFSSGPLVLPSKQEQGGFFETSSTMLAPPPSTLGATALALHYANLIIVLEKMIRSPRAVGAEARDDLYGMLTASVRGQLRARLKGVGWGSARDSGLAAEWRAALARIAEWLGPVAHDTIRWQGERSFERRSAAAPRANVLLLQTLYFANRVKVETAVTELLVGLNYLWRFEREMSALALAADHGGLQH